ncbi:hypothetical protein JCM5353_008889 [Sporobolomyces roseus]
MPSARAALYRRPFETILSAYDPNFGNKTTEQRKVVEARAVNLLAALEANDCYLGRLVHGTSGIDWQLSTMKKNRQTRRWYAAVLRACVNLQQVDLHFSKQTELEDLLRALALLPTPSAANPLNAASALPQHPSQLRSIVFGEQLKKDEQGNEVRVSDIFAALRRARLPSLATVRFNPVEWVLSKPPPPTGLFPVQLNHLHIETLTSRLTDVIAFLPRSPAKLDSFYFSNVVNREAIDLTPITKLLGNHLRTLGVKFNEYHKEMRATLSAYGDFVPGCTLALEGILSLPQLTSLTLSGTHGPSLSFLSTLAESGPLLAVLDLSHSHWRSDSNSTKRDAIFPATRVLSVLDKFRHLNDIHFGLLPTTRGERYKDLVTVLEARGIAARFDCCVKAG